MSSHCDNATGLRRLVCSLGVCLGLPATLALCILVGPNLGLQFSPQAGDCRQHSDGACEGADLDRDIPAVARPDTDALHIHIAWLQYRFVMKYRRGWQARLRSARSAEEARDCRHALAQCDDDYRCVYLEVTPAARRQAHLPDPAEAVANSQAE